MQPALFLCVLTALTLHGAAANERPWSFKPLARPPVPAVTATRWLRDGLDAFILAKLESAGVVPNGPADRATLLRRASFDLIGLPPSQAEVEAFTRDPSPDDEAFLKVLDRLLASPRFGERWARHWLDVAHYADSIGRTMNAVFPYAFRYRDYVIDSLNADKPYQRFALEQIAGDLLPWKTPVERSENLIATGFLTLGALDLSDAGGEQFVLDRIDDQIDVTTRAFLGITVACARCHDHKSDPITQRDYYALGGIFQSTATWPGVAGKGDLGPKGYVDEDKLLRLPASIPPAKKSPAPGSPARPAPQADLDAMQPARGYPTLFRFLPDRAMGVQEGTIQNCPIAIKGDPQDRRTAPPRGSIDIPGLPKLAPIPKDASGRLQLAQWLASPQHPLTARVCVNRVWHHLFGAGLVRTTDDFGATGEAPTHPELLDHLAVRFIENGWSLKKLIRAIMLSRTYRMSSTGRSPNPDEDLYWRMRPRRLELEPLRDTLLLVAGRLQTQRPEGIQVAGFGGKGKEARTRSLLPVDAPVRTVYLPVLRSLLPPLYELFDFPDPSQIKGQRDVTTLASQSLYFMNNDFVALMARHTADSLLAQKCDDSQRIQLAYLRVLARKPTTEEVDEAKAYLQRPSPQQWSAFIHALFASAEFRYIL